MGVKDRLNTTAKEIVMENGAVSGLLVENTDCNQYTIHTSHIILATGGYFGTKRSQVY